MAKSEKEPTELPPLYIRERMAAPTKVTGAVLAERMGTTPATVSRLLNGQRKMTLEWLFAFSKALGTPIASLFSPPETEERSPEARLRSALLAFGVDREDLGRAVSAVRVFVDDPDEPQSPDLRDDQPELSNRPHESEPSR